MKEQIELSAGHWSYRLIKYVFDLSPEKINNLCPYFWMTVAGILLFIPFTLFKAFSWPFRKLKRNTDYLDFLRSLSKSEIYYLSKENVLENSIDEKFYWGILMRCPKKGLLNCEIFRDLEKFLGISDKEVKEYKKDYDLEVSRRERISRVVSITKTVVGSISMIIPLIIGYITSIFLLSIICTLVRYQGWFLNFLSVSGVITSFVFYVWCNYRSLSYAKHYKGLKKSQLWYVIPLWIITSPLLIVVGFLYFVVWKTLILRFGGIFREYLKATYKDYCPGIKWEK